MTVVAEESYDLVVVGAGIVGLGAALAGLDRGLRVAVLDRGARASGSSVRNFGHVGTTAQAGEAGVHAARSRERWRRLGRVAGIRVRAEGAMLAARSAVEQELIELYAAATPGTSLLSAAQLREQSPVRDPRLSGGLLLERDLQADPRTAVAGIAAWLESQGVDFFWAHAVLGIGEGVVRTARRRFRAAAIVVAVNHDADQFFPDEAAAAGIRRCTLDMLSVDGSDLPALPRPLLTGTALLRYRGFADIEGGPALLAQLRAEFEVQDARLLAEDVNLMATQRPDGGIILGDTHQRDTVAWPVQREEAFALLLELGAELFGVPALTVRERWQGVYASAPEEFFLAAPEPGIRAISVTTGIGMSCGLGFAESAVAELLGPLPQAVRARYENDEE